MIGMRTRIDGFTAATFPLFVWSQRIQRMLCYAVESYRDGYLQCLEERPGPISQTEGL
jgi:hypothetical protein